MKSVLIADDLDQNRYLLEALLAGYGYQVVSAINGKDALNKALKDPPLLIISDILMPEMDGFELCRKWKTNQILKKIPFIFYTATYTEDKDRAFAEELGAEEFIIKPQEPEDLMKVVQKVLKDYENGLLENPKNILSDETKLDKQYGEIVSKKLEKKIHELENEISERKKVEENLRLSENRFKLVSKAITNIVYELDCISEQIKWFGNIEQETGYTTEEFPKNYIELVNLIHSDDKIKFENAFLSRRDSSGTFSFEYRLRAKNGEYLFWLDRSIKESNSNGLNCKWIGACIDRTENRKLNIELQRSQKMNAIGQLAGGIAHDFNNYLHVILGFTDFLLWNEELETKQRSILEQVHVAGKKSAELTSKLLLFSRRKPSRFEVVDINRIINGLSKIITPLIGKNIQLDIRLDENLNMTMGDIGQIEQVIVNLSANSRDAISDSGLITIETFNINHRDQLPVKLLKSNSEFIVLKFSDTGCGMSSETKNKIFEPFFSTKEIGKGTGLGMSTVYGIIKQHNGFIEVDSTIGVGTTFSIYFPVTDSDFNESKSNSRIDIIEGNETILLVEEQGQILNLSELILNKAGYTVLKANDGENALNLFKTHMHNIDLVISDIVLPKVEGKKFFDNLIHMNPKVKIILSSSFSASIIDEYLKISENTYKLHKPYDSQTLLRTVRDVLDGDTNKV